jgi:hypothetical protein
MEAVPQAPGIAISPVGVDGAPPEGWQLEPFQSVPAVQVAVAVLGLLSSGCPLL